MRFEPEALHGANAGLDTARSKMEEVKKLFPWISYGDLWTLGGVCAIQVRGTFSTRRILSQSHCAGGLWTQDPLAPGTH